LPKDKRTHFPSSPIALRSKGEKVVEAMKILRNMLFTFVAVVGLALSVSAQKDDKRDKPPKNPPTIDPVKKPPRDNPKGHDKPKKPGMAFELVVDPRETEAGET